MKLGTILVLVIPVAFLFAVVIGKKQAQEKTMEKPQWHRTESIERYEDKEKHVICWLYSRQSISCLPIASLRRKK